MTQRKARARGREALALWCLSRYGIAPPTFGVSDQINNFALLVKTETESEDAGGGGEPIVCDLQTNEAKPKPRIADLSMK